MAQITPEISDICSHCNQPIYINDRARPALTFNEVVLNPVFRSCVVEGTLVHLTEREFDVFYMLMSRQGRVCSKDTIFTVVWGLDSDAELKIIDVYVCKIRKKLGEQGKLLQTVWGRGYCIGAEKNTISGLSSPC